MHVGLDQVQQGARGHRAPVQHHRAILIAAGCRVGGSERRRAWARAAVADAARTAALRPRADRCHLLSIAVRLGILSVFVQRLPSDERPPHAGSETPACKGGARV
jgi:hypothetical protein